jgi:arabinofuranosyltransferase
MTVLLLFLLIDIASFTYPMNSKNGIMNERMYYFQWTGLINYFRQDPLPSISNEWVADGKTLHLVGAKVNDAMSIGFLGFFAGPKVYIVDHFGLADPLLARLPLTDKSIWRIGHFYRDLPAGYLDTLSSGTNKITNPSLAEYYDKLKIITRDPIWNWDRFAVIWKMNTGQYNYLLN